MCMQEQKMFYWNDIVAHNNSSSSKQQKQETAAAATIRKVAAESSTTSSEGPENVNKLLSMTHCLIFKHARCALENVNQKRFYDGSNTSVWALRNSFSSSSSSHILINYQFSEIKVKHFPTFQ